MAVDGTRQVSPSEEFTITFHGPFHVGSGVASQGLDRVVDHVKPLPATSLKGVMRAAARDLGVRPQVVTEIFGGPGGAGSPWWWSDAEFDTSDMVFDRLARIRVDDESGLVKRGFLMMGEVVWAPRARFRVAPLVSLDPTDADRDRLVLRAAARAVVAVGGSRRRGEGWVTMTDAHD